MEGKDVISYALLAVLLLPAISTLTIAAGTPSLSISPSTVEQGQQILITISNFPPTIPIGIYLNNATELTTIYTDSNGNFSGYLIIPSTIPPGDYQIEAIGVNSGNLIIAISPNNLTVLSSTETELSKYDVKVITTSYTEIGVKVPVLITVTYNGLPADAAYTPTCNLHEPDGIQTSLSVGQIGTGVYNTSFTPSLVGTYAVECNVDVSIYNATFTFNRVTEIYSTGLPVQISSSNQTIVTGIQNLASLINSVNASTASLIQTTKGDLLLALTNSEHNVEALINLTRDLVLSNVTQAKNAVISEIMNVNGTLYAIINTESGRILANISDVKTTVIAGIDNLTSLITQESNWIIGNITLKGDEVRDFINTNMAGNFSNAIAIIQSSNQTIVTGIQNLASLINSVNASTASLIQTTKGDLLLALTNSEHNVEALINLTRENLSLTIQYGRDTILAYTGRVNQSITALVLDVSNNVENNVIARISSAESTLSNKMDQNSNDIVNSIENAIDLGKGEIKSLIVTSRGVILANISTSYGNIIGKLGDLNNLVNSKSNAILYAIDSNSNKITGKIIGVIGNDYTSILNNLNGVASSIKANSNNNTERVLNELMVLEGLNGKVNKTLVEILLGISDKVDSKSDLLQSVLNGNYEKVDKKLNSINVNFNTKLGEIETKLNDKSMKLEYLINTSKGDVIGVIHTSTGWILANLSKVNQNVQDNGKLIEDKSSELGSISKEYGGTATIASIITLLAVSGLAIFMRQK